MLNVSYYELINQNKFRIAVIPAVWSEGNKTHKITKCKQYTNTGMRSCTSTRTPCWSTGNSKKHHDQQLESSGVSKAVISRWPASTYLCFVD